MINNSSDFKSEYNPLLNYLDNIELNYGKKIGKTEPI